MPAPFPERTRLSSVFDDVPEDLMTHRSQPFLAFGRYFSVCLATAGAAADEGNGPLSICVYHSHKPEKARLRSPSSQSTAGS